MLNPKIAILILAAGESSRMGKPKQLLKWKDSNLVNYSISKAIQLSPKNVFVVLGCNFEQIKNEIQENNITILENKNWKQGLGNSMAYGIRAISEVLQDVEGVLIMLADQPLIQTNHFNKLINCFIPDTQQILATEYVDGSLGVPAFFDKLYLNEIIALNSDFGAKQLFQKYSESVISIKNLHAHLDIDTFEQYKKLYQENHLK